MEKNEIKVFIEVMEAMGDVWNEEDVERVYGKYTLSEALIERQRNVTDFLDSIKAILCK